MSFRVAVIGPACPAEFAAYFDGADAERLAKLPGLGGQPVNALVHALLAAGISVDLITLDRQLDPLQLHTAVAIESPALSVFVAPYRTRARIRAADAFRAERQAIEAALARSSADILHAHWTYEFALPAVSSRRPHLVTAHDAPLTVLHMLPDPYRAVRAVLAARVGAAAEAMTAVSPSLATRLHRQMFYRGEVSVIPNIVPEQVPRVGVLAGGPVLSVGSDSSLKNIRKLVRAFALVRRHRPASRLQLVGPGLGTGHDLHLWARQGGLATGVEFLGVRAHHEVLQLMATASVLCHPSREESFGMTVAEAMSLGVPIVAGRRSGAMPWMLNEGAGGVLVDVESTKALAAGIMEVLTEERDTDRRAQHSVERVRAFSAQNVVDAYSTIYSHILAGHSRSKTARVA